MVFESGGVSLSGTIIEPLGRGPFPGMVLTHGTFPARRAFYRLFAELFVAEGIAVLVFDKRGHGLSTGDPGSTIVERADDAEAAVRFLGARPNIDRMGLWGFSNSTWSIPLVAARMAATTSAFAFSVRAFAASRSLTIPTRFSGRTAWPARGRTRPPRVRGGRALPITWSSRDRDVRAARRVLPGI